MRVFLSSLFSIYSLLGIAQQDSIDWAYNQAFNEMENMLVGETELSFKKAVFASENAFYNNRLTYNSFNQNIQAKADLAKLWLRSNHLTHYKEADSLDFAKNGAIFKLMTDTLFLFKNQPLSLPYRYDFDDFFGEKDWSKMFISKLLVSGSGNCHSMPYLYKILADEIDTKAYLSFAPNHIYIKQRSKQLGWYNTELTSAAFPIDAWIMASGFISRETILSGIYMDTLSQKQNIALCLIDLAHGYKKKKTIDHVDFVLKCCKLALTYSPNYVNALLLQSETLHHQLKSEYDSNNKKILFAKMQSTVAHLVNLGYREIPQDVYLQWLSELSENKDKYQNQKLIGTFNQENSSE